jgi:hypothetical protein
VPSLASAVLAHPLKQVALELHRKRTLSMQSVGRLPTSAWEDVLCFIIGLVMQAREQLSRGLR